MRQVASQYGSVPGGLQESAATMADPNYLDRSRQAVQQRREQAAEARKDMGVKTPHRRADDSALGAFRAGASGGKVTINSNPNIAARAGHFTKKSE